MVSRLYLYPVWIRIWHFITAILFLILIFTGISLQFVGKGGSFSIISLEKAIAWHYAAAIILTAGYLFYVLGNIFTQNSKHYRIKRENFWSDLTRQLKYYLTGMFRKEKHPFPVTTDSKFNPLQKFSYVLVMYLGMPLLIISGFGLLFPEILVRHFFGAIGLLFTDTLHISMGFILSLFLLIHIYTCTLGNKPGALFKSMINGYHEEHD